MGRPIKQTETNESRHRFEHTTPRCYAGESSSKDAKSCRVLLILTDDRCYYSLYNMLYVRGNNGDTDDVEYYVNHLVFAVLPELDGDILYTVLSFKAAPRWLRHDGIRR